MAMRKTGWATDIPCRVCGGEMILFHPTRIDLNCYCSPLCKAVGLAGIDVITIYPDVCVPYRNAMFIWNHKSYSVKSLVYSWHFKKIELGRNIVLTCPLQRCANPHHMRVRKIRPAIIDSAPLTEEGE